MPHITTCTRCGSCYEESSEERAAAPARECPRCWTRAEQLVLARDLDREICQSQWAPPRELRL